MTLGQKIFELRNKQKMSQGDLAEKLNVSRQSISKWETDASVPELDKLIMLSDLFNITIDELVRDELPEKDTDEEKESTEKRSSETVVINKQMSTQKIIGFILLGAGIICLPLLYLIGPGALIFSAAFIFFSLICFLIKKHAGLIIAWILTVAALIFFPTCTSVNIFFFLYGNLYYGIFTLQTFVAVCLWIWVISLIIYTVKTIKKRKT